MIRLALLLVLSGAAVSACGGSSSETPFPLEPDLARLDAGGRSSEPYVVFSGKPASKPAPDAGASENEP